MLEALPDTEYVVLEGIGHCPQVEAPERFVEVVERFAADARSRIDATVLMHAAPRVPDVLAGIPCSRPAAPTATRLAHRARPRFVFVAPDLLPRGRRPGRRGVALWLARDRGATLAVLGLIATLVAATRSSKPGTTPSGARPRSSRPPHHLGIAGYGDARRGRARRAARPAAGRRPAGGGAFVVSEYDTDEPQVDPAGAAGRTAVSA